MVCSIKQRMGKAAKTWLRNTAGFSLSAGFLFGLLACRRDPKAIAVIPQACGTALWEPEHAGAAGVARARGLDVYWNAPTRSHDVQKQIALLQKVVAMRYRGIVLSPDETLALRTPIENALANHIPIVVVDTELGIDPDQNLSYVLNDEVTGGRMAARRLGLILHGQGTVAVLGLDAKLQSISLRDRSFEETLATEFPLIHLVARRTAQSNIAQEQETTEEMLRGETEVDALVALSADATRGAYYALVELNRAGVTRLIGFDQDLLPPIRNGGLDSVVTQDTYKIGQLAVAQIEGKLDGNPMAAKLVVAPKLLTRDNIDAPEMHNVLTSRWWAD